MDLVVIAVVVGVALVALVAGFVLVRRRPSDRPPADARPAPPEERDVAVEPPEAGAATATIDRTAEADVVDAAPPAVDVAVPAPAEVEPLGLRERFRRRLSRARNVLHAGVADLFGRGVSDEAWDGLEEALISADVGVETSLHLVEELRRRAREEGATDAAQILELLRDELRTLLGRADRGLSRATDGRPTVWLVTGVNGTGKTTTIGKLAAREREDGRTVVLAAADTFRAAASEQLATWAERAGARIVRQEPGSDPAAVAFDAYQAAVATDASVVIVDTAGRLHNKTALMDELGKVKRVLERQAGALDEVLLVVDATTGQNGVAQARAFLEAVDVTGLVLTKLDGSSKGGIVIAVQRELGLPVKLVGLGEDIEDLALFDPDAFVDALLPEGAEV